MSVQIRVLLLRTGLFFSRRLGGVVGRISKYILVNYSYLLEYSDIGLISIRHSSYSGVDKLQNLLRNLLRKFRLEYRSRLLYYIVVVLDFGQEGLYVASVLEVAYLFQGVESLCFIRKSSTDGSRIGLLLIRQSYLLKGALPLLVPLAYDVRKE